MPNGDDDEHDDEHDDDEHDDEHDDDEHERDQHVPTPVSEPLGATSVETFLILRRLVYMNS